MHAVAARREGEEYVLAFDGGTDLRGDRLLVATGRRPRVEGIGLETVGVQAGPRGIPVAEHLRAGERLRAIGDVNGIWPLTHVGQYKGDVSWRSTSQEEMFSPRGRSESVLRSTKYRLPAWSALTRSPVWNQPPATLAWLACSSL